MEKQLATRLSERQIAEFAAASPLSVIEIQKIAQTGSVVNVAPNTARPSSMPKTSTVFLALGKGQQRIERQPAHRLSADHARPTVVDGMRPRKSGS